METYQLTPVNIQGLPNAFIFEADSVDRLLVAPGRRLLGLPRMQTAYEATLTWCCALKENGFLPAPEQVCSVTVLAEAAGHNLPAALATTLSPVHQRGDNWMGVSRFAMPRRATDRHTPYDALVGYIRIHSPAPVWVMLDTVATGATLTRGLQSAFNNAERPQRVLLATPAGSAVGMRRLVDLCARENVELVPFFFGAMFGLWEDGTGLPWCHPDTVTAETERGKANRAQTRALFNNLPGFCSVGDCSANFFDVAQAEKLLREEEERFGWKLPE